jgi:imidazolonepropionase-like amidohydrolase
MRKIAANLVFPVNGPALQNGYVVLTDDGIVVDICGGEPTLQEIPGLEYYSGILIPGFVDAYCHLEPLLLNNPNTIIEFNIDKVLRFLYSRGTNAASDQVTSYVNLGDKKSNATQLCNYIQREFSQNALNTSGNDFEKGFLLEALKLGKLLITDSRSMEMRTFRFLKEQAEDRMGEVFWVLCPSQVLSDGKPFPPVYEMINQQLQICIGTGKQKSIKQHSMLDEMLMLQQNFPRLTFSELIKWATIEGARALSLDAELGSFEKGKKPGVLLITGYDFKNNRLLPSAEITRLV